MSAIVRAPAAIGPSDEIRAFRRAAHEWRRAQTSLPGPARRLLQALIEVADEQGWSFMGEDALMREAGFGRSTLYDTLELLVALGLVVRQKAPPRSTCALRVTRRPGRFTQVRPHGRVLRTGDSGFVLDLDGSLGPVARYRPADRSRERARHRASPCREVLPAVRQPDVQQPDGERPAAGPTKVRQPDPISEGSLREPIRVSDHAPPHAHEAERVEEQFRQVWQEVESADAAIRQRLGRMPSVGRPATQEQRERFARDVLALAHACDADPLALVAQLLEHWHRSNGRDARGWLAQYNWPLSALADDLAWLSAQVERPARGHAATATARAFTHREPRIRPPTREARAAQAPSVEAAESELEAIRRAGNLALANKLSALKRCAVPSRELERAGPVPQRPVPADAPSLGAVSPDGAVGAAAPRSAGLADSAARPRAARNLRLVGPSLTSLALVMPRAASG
jgi:hypothetical protein